MDIDTDSLGIDLEGDEVVATIDVKLTHGLQSNLFVLQYPERFEATRFM
jgi:hypothetical protein